MEKSAKNEGGFIRWIRTRRYSTVLLTTLFLTTITVAGVAVYQIKTIGNDVSRITQTNMPMLDIIGNLSYEQFEQQILLQRIMRINSRPGNEPQRRNAEHAFSDLSRKMNQQIVVGENIASAAIKNEPPTGPETSYKDVLDTLRKAKRDHSNFVEHATGLLHPIERRQNAGFATHFGSVEHEAKDIATELNTLLIRFRTDTQKTALQMENYKKYAFQVLAIFLVTAVILGVLCVYISMRGVHRQTPS